MKKIVFFVALSLSLSQAHGVWHPFHALANAITKPIQKGINGLGKRAHNKGQEVQEKADSAKQKIHEQEEKAKEAAEELK